MKRIQLYIVLVVLGTAITSEGVTPNDGDLSLELIKDVRGKFKLDDHARAMRNALTATPIKDIARNRETLADHEQKFSHRIKTRGISNQKSSGRCWMFAGFNTIKPVLMNKLDLDEFDFSHIYLQFWDKMEKANTFLEYMIELRDRDLLDRKVVFLLRNPAPDGGYWENFVDLVDKYGVVPKESMTETSSSESTGMMNRNLARLLRVCAAELRQIHEDTGSVKKMRRAKRRMLATVYNMLVLNFGEPPAEFTWRYKVKNKDEAETKEDDAREEEAKSDDYDVEQSLSDRRVFTPRSFYEEFVGLDLSQYVNLANDPIRPAGRYEIDLTRNLTDGQNAHYVSVDIGTLRNVAVQMLLDNRAVYFAADVTPDQDSTKGIMARGLFDYESIYGVELDLTKAQRLLLRDSTINHGMAFIGVDLDGDKPLKWLVENSWGSERGSKGLWTMYDDWFEDNVYNVIAHKDYVGRDVLDALKKPATILPVWDPMW